MRHILGKITNNLSLKHSRINDRLFVHRFYSISIGTISLKDISTGKRCRIYLSMHKKWSGKSACCGTAKTGEKASLEELPIFPPKEYLPIIILHYIQ
jgi:hypothetical protein